MGIINHEYYVSLEVAKLLKEAGFKWKCKNLYDSQDNYNGITFTPSLKNWNVSNKLDYSAPTLDVAQRWLREVKGIYVESVLCANRGTSGYSYGFSVAEVSADLSKVKKLYPSTYFDEEETKGFKKYELSLEAGIKKTLETLLEKGE